MHAYNSEHTQKYIKYFIIFNQKFNLVIIKCLHYVSLYSKLILYFLNIIQL